MTKTVLILIAAGVFGTGTLLINNQEQENPYQPDTTGFMVQKLDHSRDIIVISICEMREQETKGESNV